MKIGEILQVTADDPAAEEDIKRLVKRLGQEILEINKKDGKIRFLIRRIS